MRVDWDKRFLDLAEYISGWSKDKSRGVGAVIVNDDKRVVAFGYNGFPSGVNDDIEARHERPAKYNWTVHAEENAITNAARIGVATKDTIMYLNLFPCARCAGNIINSGIKRVVVSKDPNFEDDKYGNEFKISQEKLREAGVEIFTPTSRTYQVDVGNVSENAIEAFVKEKIKQLGGAVRVSEEDIEKGKDNILNETTKKVDVDGNYWLKNIGDES